MAQSYTRQSTFADGDTITASLFNNEYNQLENSFSYSSSNSSITGHRHDGTAGQGGNIFKIGDIDFLNKIEVDGTSNRWGIYVEVGGVSTEQVRVQDGSIVPVTNNDIDLGTSSLEFKDLFIDGTAHIDTLDIDENATVAGTLGVTGATTLSSTLAVTGTSTLTGNVTATNDLSIGGNLTVTGNATINGNLTFGDASTDTISFVADVNSSIIPEVDDTYDLGSPTQKWRNLYIDGVANIDSISGGTIDGSTIATSDITVGAGKTLDVSAGTLTLADNQISGDKVEGGTINATTINTLTYGSLSDGVITVTAFVDEDDMISNSATLVPTQQSVKTYVDTVVAATNEVVEDATPQLGGDLDLNSNNITGTGNINITGTIQSSGNITGTLATAAQGNVTSLGTLTSLGISGDLTVDTNTLKVDSATNRVGILNVSPDVSLDIGSATDAVHVPVGTTAQRPGTPAAGYFRYNADLEQFEGYTDTWGAIGGGGTNTFTYDSYTGDGVTTNFVLSQATNLEGNLIVFIDGVFQTQDAYTISTASGITTLIFSVAPANTRKIVVYTIAAGVSGNNLNLDSFSGDGVLTDFTLSINAVSENNTQVYIDGVYQQKDGYTVTNTTLSFSSPPLNGSTIEVMTFTQTEVNVPVDNTITSAKLSGDLVTPGNLDVTGTVTADGLTVEGSTLVQPASGSAKLTLQTSNTTSDSQLIFGDSASNNIGGVKYSHSDDNMRFETAATERMRIDANGSVGIGTSAPITKLNISSGALRTSTSKIYTSFHSSLDFDDFRFGLATAIKGGATTADRYVSLDSATYTISTGAFSGAGDLILQELGGNVGIGTSTPYGKTHWQQSGPVNLIATNAAADGQVNTTVMSLIGQARSYGNNIAKLASIDFKTDATSWFKGNITFNVANTDGTNPAATPLEAMLIDASGNVGIGATPNTRLQVSSATTTKSVVETTGTTSDAIVEFTKGQGSAESWAMGLDNSNQKAFSLAYLSNGSPSLTTHGLVTVDTSGNVGIGTIANESGYKLDVRGWGHFEHPSGDCVVAIRTGNNTGSSFLYFGDQDSVNPAYVGYNHTSNSMSFKAGGSLAMTIDSSQNLLVGTTSSSSNTEGIKLSSTGTASFVRSGVQPVYVNRLTNDGDLAVFAKDGAPVGSIFSHSSGNMGIGTNDTGVLFAATSETLQPWNTSTNTVRDAAIDLGTAGGRFKDIYRSGSTFQTSDRTMKQDIRDLTDAERNVAVVCKGLLKAFRFIDAVEKEGVDANIHFGIIAQDLAAAFAAEGLDANDYQTYKAIVTTDEDGNEQTRLNVCYENLLAFIIAAI